MLKLAGCLIAGFFLLPGAPAAVEIAAGAPTELNLAEVATLNGERGEIVGQPSFKGGKGIALRQGVEPLVLSRKDHTPDFFVTVRAEKPGRYAVAGVTAVDEYGASFRLKWRKEQPHYYLKMQWDNLLPTIRNSYSPWRDQERNTTELGKFQLTGKDQKLSFQLPRGVRIEGLRFVPIPAGGKATPEMTAYRPAIVPPARTHPRVWMRGESFERVRANLAKPENKAIYEKILAAAFAVLQAGIDPGWEKGPYQKLENALFERAFVSLVENDRKLARETADLAVRYFRALEFGNALDITREIGSAIYTAALVYDWCYDALTPEERDFLRGKMLTYAKDTEIGWPPVRQLVVAGHGNEWQVSRDLLAMSIAVYDEDPEPYRYVSCLLLEKLVPMCKFKYRSPRHDQGNNYGYLRYGCDLHAAHMLERMSGKPVFDPNIDSVIDHWTYSRTPNSEMLPCGDYMLRRPYWKYPLTTMLAQAGSRSAQVKGEMMRQDSFGEFPLMALLFNDPDLKPDMTFDTLPLSIDFGPIIGGMIARTSWDMADNSSAVIAEVKGGGYNFGNHQHSDSGAVQLFYRGLQIVDLGQYRFYGTPYDFNYAKRSISHSMMLVHDPDEKFILTAWKNLACANDGGIQLNQSSPETPAMVQSDPQFYRGKVIAAGFGPDRMKPLVSHFAVDLKGAYSPKVEEYKRGYVFWNTGRAEEPAIVVIYDVIRSSGASFRKDLQFNTFGVPKKTDKGFVTTNRNAAGEGHVYLDMLTPGVGMEVKSGVAARTYGGVTYELPLPEDWIAEASRVVFTPEKAQRDDTFVTVLRAVPDDAKPSPASCKVFGPALAVFCGGATTVFPVDSALLSREFTIEIPGGETGKLLATCLAAGTWSVNGKTYIVEPYRHSLLLGVRGGEKLLFTMEKQ